MSEFERHRHQHPSPGVRSGIASGRPKPWKASAGCVLKRLWYAFGEDDGFALIEAPDTVSAAAVAIAITSSGAFSKFETTVVLTQKDLLTALEKAADVAYVAPGAAVHA